MSEVQTWTGPDGSRVVLRENPDGSRALVLSRPGGDEELFGERRPTGRQRGALAVGRLRVGRARIERLEIGELHVERESDPS